MTGLILVATDADGKMPARVRGPDGGLGLEDVLARMAEAVRLWLAVQDGVAVGVGGFLTETDQTAEIGYGVSPSCRGRGLAGQLVAALQDQARRDGLTCLTARSATANPASGAALVRAGFDQTGKVDEPGMGAVLFWSWNVA